MWSFSISVQLHKDIILGFSSQDLLQQPLMEFLGQETTRRWSRPHSIQGEKFMIDPYKVIRTLLDIVDDQTQSKAGDR